MNNISLLRKYYTLMLILLMIFCTACQATPEEATVIGKPNNIEEIIEKSNDSESNNSNYSLPDSWLENVVLNDGELTIEINAKIKAQKINNIPIASYNRKAFTVEKVKEIADYFCGEAVAYEKTGSGLNPASFYDGVDTVPEIEAAILNLNRQKSDPSSNLNTLKNEDNEKYSSLLNQIEADIEMLKQRLRTAPENEEHTPIKIDEYLLSSDLKCQFDIGNVTPAELNVRTSINGVGGNTNHLRYTNRGSASIGNLEDINNSLRHPPQIEHEEALLISQEAVNALAGEEMNLSFSGVVTYTDLSLDVEINSYLDAPQYYSFIFTRSVNEMPYTYESNIGVFSERQPEAYFEPLHYEWIEVVVDNEKVIVFDWWTPMEMEEILTENVELLSFERIQAIFSEQIAIQQIWNPAYQDYIEGRKIYIDKITLGMTRIKSPDNPDGYLMVPVWDFFGYYADVVSDKYDDSGQWDITEDNEIIHYTVAESLLTINAYDGSVIDRGLGY